MSQFDKIASQWDSNPKRIMLAEKAVSEILKNANLNSNSVALDYGTGTGLILLGLQPHVKHITGMDVSAGMLAVLKKKTEDAKLTNIEILQHNIENEKLPENSYDLVTINMALHHVENTKDFAQKAFETLKNGGKICITDLCTEDGTFHNDNTGVKHFGFNRLELAEIFKNNGFKIKANYVYNKISKNNKDYEIFILTAEK